MAHFTSHREIEEWVHHISALDHKQRDAVEEVMVEFYQGGVGIPEYNVGKLLKAMRALRDEKHTLGTASHKAVEKAIKEAFEGGMAEAA